MFLGANLRIFEKKCWALVGLNQSHLCRVMKMIAGYMNNSTLNNDDDDADDNGEDDGDDDVCHRLFYTNLSSVVRKLSSAAKAFLPHRSGGRHVGTGQTVTNLLLKMLKVKIISHQIFLFPCLSVCRQSQRLLAAFYGRLMRLPHFVHQRLLLQIHHTSHPFLCQINS